MPNPLVKKIDYLFYHEEEIRRKIKESRKDRPHDVLLIKPSGRNVSNPTLNQVVSNMMPLKYIALEDGNLLKNPELHLKLIDSTYARANVTESSIARLKYRGISSKEIISNHFISEWQYYRIINRFRMLAILFGKNFLLF